MTDRRLVNNSEPISDVQRQARVFQQRLEDGLSGPNRTMATAYDVAIQRMGIEMDALEQAIYDKYQNGEEIPVSWLHRQKRYHQLLDQAGVQFDRFGKVADQQMTAAAEWAVFNGRNDSLALIDMQLSSGANLSSFTQLPAGAVQQFQAQIYQKADNATGSISPVAGLFDSYGEDARTIVDQEITNGLIQGLHPNQVFANLRNKLGSSMVGNAMTTIRTEMYRAYRESNRAVFEANDDIVDTWIWNAYTGPFTCVACWAMHGQEFPVDTPMGSHPNCRCTMIPKTKSWAELGFEGLDAFEPPRVETGEEVFARLPDADKRKILGPKKFDAYQNDGMRLRDMVKTRRHPRYGTTRTVASYDDSRFALQERREAEGFLGLPDVEPEFGTLDDPEWVQDFRRIQSKAVKTPEDYIEMGGLIRRQMVNDGVLPENMDELADEYRTIQDEYKKLEKRKRFLERNRADDIMDSDHKLYEEYNTIGPRLATINTRMKDIDRGFMFKPYSQKTLDLQAEKDALRLVREDINNNKIWNMDYRQSIKRQGGDWEEERARLRAEVDDLYAKEKAIQKQIDDSVERISYQESVTRHLSSIRPMGRGPHSLNIAQKPGMSRGTMVKNDDSLTPLWDETMDLYPTDWNKLSAEGNPIVLAKERRGYYARDGIGTGNIDRVVTSGYDRDDIRNTFIHEAGHRFEDIVPGLRQAERDFYEFRTAGDKLTKMSTVTGDSGYRANEVTRPDRFFDPYIGKDYGGVYYEVATMGFQAVLDPLGPGKHRTPIYHDPEMIDFILGILGGL